MKELSEGDIKVLILANNARIELEDIIEFVEEMKGRKPEDRTFDARSVLLARLHSGNPDKALAIEFRMHALSRLTDENPPKGWTLPEQSDGAVPINEAMFAAAAVEPIIYEDGEVAFDRESFMNKVLELSDTDGSA